jgi:hypothetical protein
MTAKEYLKQIEHKRHLIERGNERLREMREMTVTLRGVSYDTDRVQTSTHSGITAGIEKLTDMENKLNKEILRYFELSNKIIDQINGMEDLQCSELLYLRYVSCLRWEEIACRMHIGIRGVYKAHGRALRMFAEKYKEFI